MQLEKFSPSVYVWPRKTINCQPLAHKTSHKDKTAGECTIKTFLFWGIRLWKLSFYPLQKSDIRNRTNRLLRAFVYEVWQAAFAQIFTRGWLETNGVLTSIDWPNPGSTVLLETDSPSAGHKIRCLVCNLQSHYRVHVTTTMVLIPRQIYPVHITSYFGNIHFSTIFLFTYYRISRPIRRTFFAKNVT
jgi:hypothetical protein